MGLEQRSMRCCGLRGGRCGRSAPQLGLAGQDPAVEFVNHAGYIGARLGVWRNPVVFVDGFRPCVICGQRQSEVIVIVRQQRVKIR